MKVNQRNFKQILKLHLLRYKVYENSFIDNDSSLMVDLSLNQTLINFKKILQIIFQYHIHNKNILFIGVPKKLESKINRLTHHVAIPKYFETNGLLSNNGEKKLNKKKLQSDAINLSYSKLSRQPDLIVAISCEKIENLLKECSIAKVPLLNFVSDDSFTSDYSSYSYKSNLGSKKIDTIYKKNLLFIGLNFLFKINDQRNRNLS